VHVINAASVDLITVLSLLLTDYDADILGSDSTITDLSDQMSQGLARSTLSQIGISV